MKYNCQFLCTLIIVTLFINFCTPSFSIAQLQKINTCEDHGGVDCAAGPTKYEMAKCSDGWQGADVPFYIACSNVILKIVETSIVLQSGEIITLKKRQNIFDAVKKYHAVIIQWTTRNTSPTVAKDVKIEMEVSRIEKLRLEGAAEIAAYGVENYTLSVDDFFRNPKPRYFNSALLKVNCKNCQ